MSLRQRFMVGKADAQKGRKRITVARSRRSWRISGGIGKLTHCPGANYPSGFKPDDEPSGILKQRHGALDYSSEIHPGCGFRKI